MTISYEQLLADPERNMQQMITFIDPSLPTDGWISSASTLIQQKARSSIRDSALETACQPGQAIHEILEKEGLHSARLREILQSFVQMDGPLHPPH